MVIAGATIRRETLRTFLEKETSNLFLFPKVDSMGRA
jgi:hypothetical protein